MVEIKSVLERDRARRPVQYQDYVLPIVKEAIGADDVAIMRTDDIYTDAMSYRIVLPSGLAIPVRFSGLELVQNQGEHLRDLVFHRVNEAFGKFAQPI